MICPHCGKETEQTRLSPAEGVFMTLLREVVARREHVSFRKSKRYAPRVFADMERRRGGAYAHAAVFVPVMARLHERGLIAFVVEGPPSQRYGRVYPLIANFTC